jgi:hypothetical protein
MVTEIEQYLFDLQGFLVVEDALTGAELAALNEIIDQQIALVMNQEAVVAFQPLTELGNPLSKPDR